LAGVSTTNPATGASVAVQSMLTAEGLQMVLGTAVTNFATFPPMATIITVLLGIAVAEKSGLIDTLLHGMVTRVPPRYLTFAPPQCRPAGAYDWPRDPRSALHRAAAAHVPSPAAVRAGHRRSRHRRRAQNRIAPQR